MVDEAHPKSSSEEGDLQSFFFFLTVKGGIGPLLRAVLAHLHADAYTQLDKSFISSSLMIINC